MLELLVTVNQILMAAIAITAFSLLLYSLTFNLRERVTRSFSIILVSLAIVYSAESLASVASDLVDIEFWLKAQWVGIVFLPAGYLHFSDAVLASTGRPSKGKRRWGVRFGYLISAGFLICLPLGYLVGPLLASQPLAPYLQPTWLTDVFILYYGMMMVMSWYNFVRAFRRSATSSGRRRMMYLLIGSIAPTLGSFPFLLFSSGFAARHAYTFWFLSTAVNFLAGGLVVVMAYSVAFFGVSLPDRTVKNRLARWILRGPIVASLALGLTTIVRRIGEDLTGNPYHAVVPITVVGAILIGEYLITVTIPYLEAWLFYGDDKKEILILRNLEDRLVTRNDLRQFLEMNLSAICDRMQVSGAFVAAMGEDGLQLIVKVGKTIFDRENYADELNKIISIDSMESDYFQWGEDVLYPIFEQDNNGTNALLGLLGVTGLNLEDPENDLAEDLGTYSERIAMALKDRRLQENIFKSLDTLSTESLFIEQMRATGRYDKSQILPEQSSTSGEAAQWVKDALTHFWGGPKLTNNPLMNLEIVKRAVENSNGNSSNALRGILREAITQVKPEGERKFTAEWVLYNILEMKFLEGKKVREIAMRLAMSEADLYRKQRVAIEVVTSKIMEMETKSTVSSELLNKT